MAAERLQRAIADGRLDEARRLVDLHSFGRPQLWWRGGVAFRRACAGDHLETAMWVADECRLTARDLGARDRLALRQARAAGARRVVAWLSAKVGSWDELPRDLWSVVARHVPRDPQAALVSTALYDAVRGGDGPRGAPTVRFRGGDVAIRTLVLDVGPSVDGWSILRTGSATEWQWRTALRCLQRATRDATVRLALWGNNDDWYPTLLHAATEVRGLRALHVYVSPAAGRPSLMVGDLPLLLARLALTPVAHVCLVGIRCWRPERMRALLERCPELHTVDLRGTNIDEPRNARRVVVEAPPSSARYVVLPRPLMLDG
jgi:hypothetical protein